MEQNVGITREEIGDRVRDLRLERGWTDEILGQMIGLTGSSLNNKERGVRDFNMDEIIRLSDVFGITIDELIRGIEPENLAAHRKTGLGNDAVNALKSFSEMQTVKEIKGLNLALSSPYVLDALARYMCFSPKEKGYYLSETATYEHDRFIECRMSHMLYFNVLGQNLLQVLNDARRRDYSSRIQYGALDDFIDFIEESENEHELAEPSGFDQQHGKLNKEET